MHLVGNPGLFAVDGAIVAVTATDVLFQLSSQEIFENKRDGAEVAALPRVARLASHLVSQRSFSGQQKRAKFPTSKAPLSAGFHSFRLIFGRAIISRNGLEAWMLFPERARAEHSR